MSEASPSPTATSKPSGLTLRLLGSTLGPLLALFVVFALFATIDYATSGELRFVSARNLRIMSIKTTMVAVAALGMTAIIIAGGIDLSAGTALALSATVLALLLRDGYSATAAVSGGIAVGLACGLLNGVLITALRLVPFIVTLGTMTIYLGIAKLISNETTVRPLPEQIPAWIPALLEANPKPEWLFFPIGVWAAMLLAVLLSLVLRYTVFGRYVFAIGSNESTARLCGVNVPSVKIAIYTLAGLFVGMAGIYQFSRLSNGNPTSGSGLELKIIAAVVVGGASLSGGRGTVLGTVAGATMMGVIDSGCVQLGLPNPVQDIIVGVVIIAAAALDQVRQRRLV
jgi:ribose transport system permease protein